MSNYCYNETIPPSATEYFKNLPWKQTIPIIVCFVFSLLICALGVLQFAVIERYVSRELVRMLLGWLVAVFPVTAIFALVGLCVPRSFAVIDLFIANYYSVSLFIYVTLVRELFGGIEKMESELRDVRINLSQSLFRCCSCCLPRLEPHRNNIRMIEWLVYQGSIVKLILFMVNYLLYVETKTLDHGVLTIIIYVLNTVSGVIAMWGAKVLSGFTENKMSGYGVTVIAHFLLATISLNHIQHPIFQLILRLKAFKCTQYLSAENQAFFWEHVVLVVEMLSLSFVLTRVFVPSRNKIFDKYYRLPSNRTGEERENEGFQNEHRNSDVVEIATERY